MRCQQFPLTNAMLLVLLGLTITAGRSVAISTPPPTSCGFVVAWALGEETGLQASQETCLECLGTSCDFVYFSESLPGAPCRQLDSSQSSAMTEYAYRQCGQELPDCNDPSCGTGCSPCREVRTVLRNTTCNETDGVRTCVERTCNGSLVRVRITNQATGMAGNCEAFCTLGLLGCQAFVQTNSSCVALQRLDSVRPVELVFANATSCEEQVSTDYCFSNPCQNGGNCTNGTNSFQCLCPANFTGATCQSEIDDSCLSDPCNNGGTCMDNEDDGFTCVCAEGFTGDTCETATSCPCVTTTPGVSAMVSNFSVGSNVTFMCLDNFMPASGDATQTCLPNGTWSGSPLMCEAVVDYVIFLRVLGRSFSVLTFTLVGERDRSQPISVRIVPFGLFSRGITIPVSTRDLGTLQHVVVEAQLGRRFGFSRSVTVLFRVAAPTGRFFSFSPANLSNGEVRELPATPI